MWPNNYIKLNLFLYLTILATLTRGQDITETTTDSLAMQNVANDVTEKIVMAENLNIENGKGEDQITVNRIGATSVEELRNVEEENSNIKSDTNETESTTKALDAINNGQLDVDSTTESEINSESVTEGVTDTNVAAVTVEDSATESVTNKIDCVCDCIANGSQVKLECSTQTPQETQTENPQNSKNDTPSNSDSNTDELETTNPTIAEDNENSETTTESNINEDTTTETDTNRNPETTTESKATTLPPTCSTPGVQSHATVCQQYYDCTTEGSLDGNFHLLTKSCPDKQAFSIELNRCSRELSSCSNPIECLVKGGVSDPASNSSYYLCEPRLIGEGFRVFHIDCSLNEIFYPQLGKCFVDINNLPSQIYPPFYNWNQLKDIDIVKAEIKLLKEQDKLILKQEKDRIKAEEKLQKQIEKEAKKRAKEEEKLNKEKAKQEAASFICVNEGNFKSPVGDETYFACISKKGKLKALVMQCPLGSKFNADSGTCVNNSPNINGNETDDDDDDDSEDDD